MHLLGLIYQLTTGSDIFVNITPPNQPTQINLTSYLIHQYHTEFLHEIFHYL